MKKSKGFTLIELLTVVGIVSILSGGVLFSFSRMSTQSFLEENASRIRNLIILGRGQQYKGRDSLLHPKWFNFNN